MKKLLLAVFAVFTLTNFNAQEFRIVKGGVTDSLPVPGTKSASYSLYVPRDYSPDKQWPVVFVFDPRGRGSVTANLFRSAAEQQQYLIASSNIDLKSQPIDSIVQTATMMVNTVLNTFPIDRTLVYLAGMGDGAQVSSALALVYKQMSGVIAVGNSFVNKQYLDKSNPYMFIGIAGVKDYMVYEMESYIDFYDNLNFPTDIYYFDGKENEWPGQPVISNAMAGFTLEAIKKGKRPRDQDFIRSLYEMEVEYTESLRRTRNYFDAYQKLQRMKDKYEDFGFEDDIKDRMKLVKSMPGFRSQRSDFRAATSFEKEQQAEYDYLLETDIITTNFQNIGWWAYQVDELEKLKQSSNDAKANMAYRLHGYLDFVSKRKFNDIIKTDDVPIDAKIFISVLRTAIQKDDPEAYLKIISLAGSDGDYETAVLYLEDLLKTGYKDMDSLYDTDIPLDLQFSTEYNEIVKKYLGEAKYFIEN